MRPNVDEYFMEMARLVSSRSTCVRRAVGCVLVDAKNRVLATGYNGVPTGQEHCNEPVMVEMTNMTHKNRRLQLVFEKSCPGSTEVKSGQSLDSCFAVHAEQNAVLQCPDTDRIVRAYVTAFPCTSCAKLLLNTGCRDIIYDQEYGDSVGMNLWLNAGRVAVAYDGEPHMIQRDLVYLFGNEPLTEWRVAVACVCLNLCSARVARPVVMRILERWPEPYHLASADADLDAMLKPLGLQKQRAKNLRGLSGMWGKMKLEELPGVGPYALESIKVFCRNELDIAVSDRKVAAWVAWRKARKL